MLKSKERGKRKTRGKSKKTRKSKLQCKSKEREKTHKARSAPSLEMAPENAPYTPCLMKMKNVMCPSNSPATAPENVLDSNNSVATLGLQVQSVVASVFSLQMWLEGLYRTLGELANDCSFLLFKQPTKQIKLLVSPTPPSGCQAQGFV